MDHNPSKSFVTCEDGTLIEAAVVLDATGHSRRLVKYDKPFNPGYQIAYGIVAEVCNLHSSLLKMCSSAKESRVWQFFYVFEIRNGRNRFTPSISCLVQSLS